MGETEYFQPLTPGDKISVILYRAGIVLSTLLVLAGACFLSNASRYRGYAAFVFLTNVLIRK